MVSRFVGVAVAVTVTIGAVAVLFTRREVHGTTPRGASFFASAATATMMCGRCDGVSRVEGAAVTMISGVVVTVPHRPGLFFPRPSAAAASPNDAAAAFSSSSGVRVCRSSFGMARTTPLRPTGLVALVPMMTSVVGWDDGGMRRRDRHHDDETRRRRIGIGPAPGGRGIEAFSAIATEDGGGDEGTEGDDDPSSSTTSSSPRRRRRWRPFRLVVVESPAKAGTIQSILNSYSGRDDDAADGEASSIEYLVESCHGHVRDLPTSAGYVPDEYRIHKWATSLGVDVEDGYKPLYVTLPGKAELLRRLYDLIYHGGGGREAGGGEGDGGEGGMMMGGECVEVILATDEDREGEAISWHLADVLHLLVGERTEEEDRRCHYVDELLPSGKGTAERRTPPPPPFRRVTFNEITPKAIEGAFFPHADDSEATVATDDAVGDAGEEEEGNGVGGRNGGGIDMDLVEAQETRRVLDRLAGYTMSPLLWRKIAPGLSAGRVQSVGLSLVVRRERERMSFVSSEYWDAEATLTTTTTITGEERGEEESSFVATLRTVNGMRIATGRDFNGTTGLILPKEEGEDPSATGAFFGSPPTLHLTRDTCEDLVSDLNDSTTTTSWRVSSVESRTVRRRPPPPYVTSTMQRDANALLGLSVSDAMGVAQDLYEAGCISYVRTDNPSMSDEAVTAAEAAVVTEHGEGYLAVPGGRGRGRDGEEDGKKTKKKTTAKKKKKQHAQEAHEAIRPAVHGGAFVHPDDLDEHLLSTSSSSSSSPDEMVRRLTPVARRLYELIYRRACASRMADRVVNRTTVVVEAWNAESGTDATFVSSGSVVVFPGYSRAYDRDDLARRSASTAGGGGGGGAGEGKSRRLLPPLVEGMELGCIDLSGVEHHTQPPPRYTEASFVGELERLGVGRPSTYASVISTLRDRAYVIDGVTSNGGGVGGGGRRGVGGGGGVLISARRAAGGGEGSSRRGGRGPLVPSLSAFVVCTLLERHCPTFVDPAFTADMELRLDEIASGDGLGFREAGEVDGVDRNRGSEERDGARLSYLTEYYAGENGLERNVSRMFDTIPADEARRVNLPSLASGEGDIESTTATANGASVADDATPVRPAAGLFIGPWGPYIQRLSGFDDDETTSSAADTVADDDGDEHDSEGMLVEAKGKRATVTAPLPSRLAGDLSAITQDVLEALLSAHEGGGFLVGRHPDSGRPLRVRVGRYGPYIQHGEPGEEDTTTHSLPNDIMTVVTPRIGGGASPTDINESSPSHNSTISGGNAGEEVLPSLSQSTLGDESCGILTLDEAVGYADLPRQVGTLNDLPMIAGLGPYGPYVKYNNSYVSIPADESVLTISEESSTLLVTDGIINKPSDRGARRGVVAELGERDGGKVTVRNGRFGVYLNWKRVNAKIPTEYLDDPPALPLDEAWRLIQEKAGSKSLRRKTRGKGKNKGRAERRASKGKNANANEVSLPPRPKRPMSSYLHFCAANRPEVAKTCKSLGEVSKELARLWAAAGENGGKDRKPYEQLAIASREKYELEKLAWEDECKDLMRATKNV